MTLALESEIVASHFNPQTRQCSYTIARNGKRWTVKMHSDELAKHKQRPARRNFIATRLETAMRGEPDA